MAVSWHDIFDLGERQVPDAGAEAAEEAEEPQGVFRRLRQSLAHSRQALAEEISASIFDRIDDETWEHLEELLILADVGAPTTAAVVEKLEHEVDSGAVPAEGEPIRDRLIEMLAEVEDVVPAHRHRGRLAGATQLPPRRSRSRRGSAHPLPRPSGAACGAIQPC